MVIILCTGIIRSGSTWSYNIIKELTSQRHSQAKILSKYEDDVEKIIENDIYNYDYIILKSHNVSDFGKMMIKHKCVKVICTYRDPLETIVSGMQVFNQNFDGMLNAVKNSFDFLQFQKKYGDLCLIKYEDIIKNSLSVIERINLFLQTKLESIDYLFKKENVREKISNMSKGDIDVVDEKFSPYHKENLFHLNHIRENNAPKWEDYLSPEQKEKAKIVLKDHLQNY